MSERPEFKAVSEAFKRMLLALGETPKSHHEAQVKNLATQTVKVKHDTVKLPSIRELNAKVVQRRIRSPEERRAEAIRLESLANRSRPEIADAIVLFLETIRCSGCGRVHTTLGFSGTFLRVRRVLAGGKLELLAARYVPTNSEEGAKLAQVGKLPRIMETNERSTDACQACFTHAVISIPPAATDDTKSSPSEESSTSVLSTPGGSTDVSESQETTPASPAQTGPSGTPTSSSTPSGESYEDSLFPLDYSYAFISSESGKSAPALDSTSPT